jgi:hypothetical protein
LGLFKPSANGPFIFKCPADTFESLDRLCVDEHNISFSDQLLDGPLHYDAVAITTVASNCNQVFTVTVYILKFVDTSCLFLHVGGGGVQISPCSSALTISNPVALPRLFQAFTSLC